MVANVIGAKKPPWMELDQWWRLWHRTGHRWIEKCNMNVLIAIRKRALSWADQLGNVLRGRFVLSEVQNGILEVWRKMERESVELERVEMEWFD